VNNITHSDATHSREVIIAAAHDEIQQTNQAQQGHIRALSSVITAKADAARRNFSPCHTLSSPSKLPQSNSIGVIGMLLETGERIVRVLREAKIARGHVFATADLAGVAAKDQVTPACHVTLLDYAPVGVIGAEVEWKEIWCVWVVVKNVARKDRPQAQVEEARPIVEDVLHALLAPMRGARPLKVTEGPAPDFTETHAYFPIAFEARAAT
jgi:hypothetical protein